MHGLTIFLLFVLATFGFAPRSQAIRAQCCDAGWMPAYAVSHVSMARTPVSLFDGRTLNGWGDRDGNPNDNWDIDDGAIHRKSGGKDLYLQVATGDFELSFEWKIAAGANSGVKYRVARFGEQWLGCEYQLLDDIGARENNKSASLYDVAHPGPDKPPVNAGQWNRSRIVVRNNRIEHWLNGMRVVQITTGTAEWRQAVSKGKFAAIEGFGENAHGRIFLQNHGSEVWFRNLYLTSFAEPCMEAAGYSGPRALCRPTVRLWRNCRRSNVRICR